MLPLSTHTEPPHPSRPSASPPGSAAGPRARAGRSPARSPQTSAAARPPRPAARGRAARWRGGTQPAAPGSAPRHAARVQTCRGGGSRESGQRGRNEGMVRSWRRLSVAAAAARCVLRLTCPARRSLRRSSAAPTQQHMWEPLWARGCRQARTAGKDSSRFTCAHRVVQVVHKRGGVELQLLRGEGSHGWGGCRLGGARGRDCNLRGRHT